MSDAEDDYGWGDKSDFVRRATQTRPHGCHWPGCTKQVPPARWGCRAHWFALPKALRDRVWAAYRPGQESDLQVAEDYFKVANDVRRWVVGHAARQGGEGVS